VVFWSSLLGKESWMFSSLGFTTYCLVRLLRTAEFRFGIGFALGAGFVVLIRPPIGAAVMVAAVAATILAVNDRFLVDRAGILLRPVAACTVLGLGAASIAVSPLMRYGWGVGEGAGFVDRMLLFAAVRHVATAGGTVGANAGVAFTDPTISGFLMFLPYGIFTALFRPLIYEAHNALAVVASLDGTLLIALMVLRWRSLVTALRHGVRSPLIVFSFMTFFLFAVTLSTEGNFGVIVRHRVMIYPFLFILLATPSSLAPTRRNTAVAAQTLVRV